MNTDFDIAYNIYRKLVGKVDDETIAHTIATTLAKIRGVDLEVVSGYGEGIIEAQRMIDESNEKGEE